MVFKIKNSVSLCECWFRPWGRSQSCYLGVVRLLEHEIGNIKLLLLYLLGGYKLGHLFHEFTKLR